MAGIRLNWSHYGSFDSFEVMRSNNAMSDDSLPSPIVEGLQKMTYLDTDVVAGATYYYRVAVLNQGVRAVSQDIVAIAAEVDVHRANVHALLYLNNSLLEEQSQTLFSNYGGAGFVDSPFGKSLLLTGGKWLKDTRGGAAASLSGTSFTVELFAKQSASNTGGGVVLSAGAGNSATLSWWFAVNKTSLALTQSINGSGGSTNSGSMAIPPSIPDTVDRWVHYAITKDDAGLVRYFADGILLGSRTYPTTFRATNTNLVIGRLDYPSYSYDFKGEVGPVRVTKGVVRYTEDFIPPTNFAGIR